MANDDYNNVDEDDDEWEHSDAKKLLKGDLLSGKIPLDGEGMTPQEAYLQRPEFIASDPKYKRFPNRLRALREQLIAKNDRADEDREALLHDRKLHPIPERNHRGELRWEGSEVQRLLRLDMDSGKHKTMKPSELYQSREEYNDKDKGYPLEVFRQHIHQEVRKRKFDKYLTMKREKKDREEKEKREKKKEQKKKEQENKEKKKEAEKKKMAEKQKKEREKQEKKKKKQQEMEEKKKKKELEKKKKKEQQKNKANRKTCKRCGGTDHSMVTSSKCKHHHEYLEEKKKK